MRSSETSSNAAFAPLVESGTPAASEFRPFGSPAAPPADEAATAPPAPAPLETSDEVRRAFQAGYELGHDEAQGQLATIAESFVKSLEELSAFRARLRERYERELLELALGVARKVVQGELAARPEIWLAMIRSAVHRAVDREHIVLRVPPPLLVFLRDRLPELRASLEAVKELELVEDPGLPPGGCVVESRFGEVDIGVDPQLEAVERAILGTEE